MADLTSPHFYKTELNNRTLWFDGDSTFRVADIETLLHKFDIRFVDEITPAIRQFNTVAPRDKEIRIKSECNSLSKEWTIPDSYKDVNVDTYILDRLARSIPNFVSNEEWEARLQRARDELQEYSKRGLYDVLRVVIFVINTLIAKGVVWGVGRGSSVSSYVLFLIGVHDVDSFAYELDIGDFLRD